MTNAAMQQVVAKVDELITPCAAKNLDARASAVRNRRMKFLLPLFALAAAASLAADGPANENKATPPARIKVAKGFAVELLYSVPAAEQGSWVSLCADDKGRIYAGDQYGAIYRFAPPTAGQPLDPATIQKVPAPIKAANGMLWAFGALWVGVNDSRMRRTAGCTG